MSEYRIFLIELDGKQLKGPTMKLNLDELRKKKKMTQEMLASAVGASKRQIGAWERGENDIPMDFAVLIADTLDCSIDDIAGREVNYAYVSLSDDEKSLLKDYRDSSEEGRKAIEATAKAMSKI